MAEYKIRPVVESDLDGIDYVMVSSWNGAYKNLIHNEFFETRTVEKLKERRSEISPFITGSCVSLVLTDSKNQIVGIAFGDKFPRKEQHLSIAENGGWLDTLYILPELYGSGLGKVLFINFAKDIQAKGIEHFSLSCLKSNKIGRKFYDKMEGSLLSKEGLWKSDGYEYPEVYYRFEISKLLRDNGHITREIKISK